MYSILELILIYKIKLYINLILLFNCLYDGLTRNHSNRSPWHQFERPRYHN